MSQYGRASRHQTAHTYGRYSNKPVLFEPISAQDIVKNVDSKLYVGRYLQLSRFGGVLSVHSWRENGRRWGRRPRVNDVAVCCGMDVTKCITSLMKLRCPTISSKYLTITLHSNAVHCIVHNYYLCSIMCTHNVFMFVYNYYVLKTIKLLLHFIILSSDKNWCDAMDLSMYWAVLSVQTEE